MAEKDNLVSQNPAQKDPYKARASEFSIGNASSMAQGTAEGANQLAQQSANQCGPRYAQDDGPGSSGAGTPANWAKNDFKISRNSGEGMSSPSSVTEGSSIDLTTGRISVAGVKATRVGEVLDPKLSIASR